MYFLFPVCKTDTRLEGWLSLPMKNTKRFGWERRVWCPFCLSDYSVPDYWSILIIPKTCESNCVILSFSLLSLSLSLSLSTWL